MASSENFKNIILPRVEYCFGQTQDKNSVAIKIFNIVMYKRGDAINNKEGKVWLQVVLFGRHLHDFSY